MFWYAIASLSPAVLLALACLLGGVVPLLALFSITALVFFLDRLSRHIPESAGSGRALTLTLALFHFVLLILGVRALGVGPHLGLIDKLLIFTGLGLYFGQVSNSNAHELIHASARLPRRVGAAIYISLLHGHHVSAHLHVHHVHVATDADPNSARKGEGFWRYALRVFKGEFTAGLHAEAARQARASRPRPAWQNPYVAYVLGGMIALAVSFLIAGAKGVLIYIALAFYAQLQLLLSDYVQHYGLRRRIGESGKPEPIGTQHSWNAPKWYSNAMMLNAPKHSDHHLRPARAFPGLENRQNSMPQLPHSLPVMAVIALFPPLWRRKMDHRVSRWQKMA